MSDVLGCVLNPGQCIDGAITAWLAWVPFGSYGVIFVAGLIVGAILGRWGVAALLAAFVALKFASKREPDLFPHEDPKPVPVPKKKPKSLFGK